MRAKRLLRRVGQALRSLLIILIAIPLCGSLYIAAAKHLFGQKNPTFFGFTASIVLTGSMSGAIESNDVVVTRQQDSYAVGDIITFSAEGTSVTHRIAAADGEGYRTKGDANEAEDGGLVHYKNVIGTPIFSIPYLGYVADYIQHPPGMYVAISAGAILLLLVFIPDIFADDKDKEQDKKKKSSRRNKGAHVAAHEAAAVDAATEEPASESLADEIRRKTDNLLTDEEIEDICREVEAGRFDDAAADALRQELLKREAKRDEQEVPH